jgi:hypothetical protein
MIGKLMSKEEVNAALVVALSGTIMVLVANGFGPASLRRVVSGALSNPVSEGVTGPHHFASVPALNQQIAA